MKKKTEIEVKTARLQKLDPSKPYLVRLDETFTNEEMELLSAKLKEWGLEKVMVIVGDVKISEIKQ